MRLRVLLVEDDALLRASMMRVLTRELDVTAVRNGREALALLDEGHEADVLVTDLSMPEMDGAALVGILSERGHALASRVVLFTGDLPTGERRMEAAGLLVELLEKPVGHQELLDAVRRAASVIA